MMNNKAALTVLITLILPFFANCQDETSLLTNKYEQLLEQVKTSYEHASDEQMQKYEEQFRQLNNTYKLFEDDLSNSKKKEINKLRGEIRGYIFMRDLEKTKEQIQKGYENLISNSQGFIAALRVDGSECAKNYEKLSNEELLQQYKDLANEVAKHSEDYDKADWDAVENKYDCLNYSYYQKKESFTEVQKDEFNTLYKKYNTAKYKWKLERVREKMQKGFQSLEKEAEALFE